MNRPDERSIDARIAELQELARTCSSRLLQPSPAIRSAGSGTPAPSPFMSEPLPVSSRALARSPVAPPAAVSTGIGLAEHLWMDPENTDILCAGERHVADFAMDDTTTPPRLPRTWPAYLMNHSALKLPQVVDADQAGAARQFFARCLGVFPKVATVGRWTAAILLAGASALFLVTWPHSIGFAVTTDSVPSQAPVVPGFNSAAVNTNVRRVMVEKIIMPPEEAPQAALETAVKTVSIAGLTPDQFIKKTWPVPGITAISPAQITHVQTEQSSSQLAQVDTTGAMNYLARGEMLLRTGDIASARLMFKKVTDAGDARGAIGIASTYDPNVLRSLPVYGLQGNPEKAREWYEKAKGLGASSEAVARMEALSRLTN
jgi:hypothetical protein